MSAIGSRHAQIFSLALLALIATAAAPSTSSAQFDVPGVQSAVGADDSPYKITAQFTAPAGGQPGRLFVTAEIGDGWHVYSITQAPGGPVRTTIAVDPTAEYKLGGDFKSIQAPEKHADATFNNLIVESHKNTVTWYAPLEFTAGVDLEKLKVAGAIKLQACTNDNCLPPKKVTFVAALGPGVPIPPPAAPGNATSDYAPPRSHTTIRGVVQTLPGGQAQLRFTFEPAAHWHLYPGADRAPKEIGPRPTLIVLTDKAGFAASRPAASTEPESHPAQEAGKVDRFYTRPVTWTVDLTAPKDAKAGTYKVAGLLGFQTCKENSECDLPQAARFEAEIPLSGVGEARIKFAAAKSYALAAQAAESTSPAPQAVAFDRKSLVVEDSSMAKSQPIWFAMLMGLAGGFVLNFMPCVLPVIGLKILSFVEQSGHARSRVFMLNVWYSLGMLAVFMGLAILAAFFGLGWGAHLGNAAFSTTLAAVVFVMALSFLGVWEIPIPGFVGAGKANDLAAQEGAAGAFFKGVITTVLATPCSGPFLGTALVWSVGQPPHLVFTLFGFIALGMASPYLLIGAVPSLIRFLPRPGAWMDTFKQIMGFMLLATVVYILTFLPIATIVPAIALLFGLWAACWWIGRTPLTADFGARLRAWAQAAAFAAIVWVFTFPGLTGVSGGRIDYQGLRGVMTERFEAAVAAAISKQMSATGNRIEPATPDAKHHAKLPWKPFSEPLLVELTAAKKTVLVDFTADWCPTCKALEALVLNTAETRRVVDDNGIETLVADWTNVSDEVTQMLKALGSEQIPLLAIFPADRPNNPRILTGGYTQAELLKALKEAGPSKGAEGQKITAIEPR